MQATSAGMALKHSPGRPMRGRVVIRFLRWFLPIAVVIVIGAALIGFVSADKRMGEIAAPEHFRVHLAGESLDGEVARPIRHLNSLAHLERGIQRVVDSQPAAIATPMVDAFISLISRNPEYMQMRWIGDDGMERVRVDRTPDGGTRALPPRELQDKRNRYYVTGTLRLKFGEIFVSPLDLNIEHNQIEIPYRPVVRLGTRVYRSDGTANGMLILNVSAQNMLERFAQHGQGSDMVLLNADGFWLKSRNSADEWGFMLHKRETFGQRYPSAWKFIAATNAGQRKTAKGLWTWQTVHVTPEHAVGVNPIYWKVVSRVSTQQLDKLQMDAWLPSILGICLLLPLFGVGIWQLSRETEARISAEVGLREERTSLVKANQQLQLAANVLNNITEGVVITTSSGVIVSVNPAYCEMTGFAEEELVGGNPRLINSGKHDAQFYRDLWNSLDQHGYWEGEIWNKRRDGGLFLGRETITAIRDNLGHLQHYIGVLTDITETRRAEDSIRHQAYHDALTGLPNRTLLMDRLRLHLSLSHRHHKQMAVLFIDLDGFKAVNDEVGHDAGDDVLKETAARLLSCVRESDTVARLGGDEFVAVLNDLTTSQDVTLVAQKMLDALQRPFLAPEQQRHLSASIGIAVYPDVSADVSVLLAAADEAMYSAKRRGKAAYAFASVMQRSDATAVS